MPNETSRLLEAANFARPQSTENSEEKTLEQPLTSTILWAVAKVLANEGGVIDVDLLIAAVTTRHGRGHANFAK